MAQVIEKEFQTEEARWMAVCERDRAADGAFFYAVQTTGVFCRPQCGARTPLRVNVSFYDSVQEAKQAGFRPCKRCKPQQEGPAHTYAAVVADACRWMEQAEKAPTLAELAERAGLSPYYFHRIFKQYTGVTPKAYARGQRGNRMREALTKEPTVTDAIYEAGYETSSRFYEEMPRRLGMTPSQYRKGGLGQKIRHAVVETNLGFLLMAATSKGLCLIQFGESREALGELLGQHFPQAEFIENDESFISWTHQITSAIAGGQTPSNDLPLDIRGTAFQQQVWEALRQIPSGKTATYSDVAALIGRPRAVRAVANACGSNPVAMTVPCHRVVRSDGSMGGYRWGEDRKRQLLEREAVS